MRTLPRVVTALFALGFNLFLAQGPAAAKSDALKDWLDGPVHYILEAIRARLKTPAIFDGRNLYDPREVKRHGIEYFPIGRRA